MTSTAFAPGLIALALAGTLCQAQPVSQTWVEVTVPMVSCGAIDDRPDLAREVLLLLIDLPNRQIWPEGCQWLEPGQVLMLDPDQSARDTEYVVKMWDPVCPQGCLPTMTPVYAPPRRLVGAYLQPTDPPPGW